MAQHKYEGWVLLLVILGSLFAAAAIFIAEGIVPQADLVLTQGEYEAFAVVFYIFGVVLWLAGGERGLSRAG
jgi:hypothetical protein